MPSNELRSFIAVHYALLVNNHTLLKNNPALLTVREALSFFLFKKRGHA